MKGFIDAIPIIAYHSITWLKRAFNYYVGLFVSEMKYLHNNGFKVIPMSDLGNDESTKHI